MLKKQCGQHVGNQGDFMETGAFFFLKATVYTHSIRQHPVCQQIHTFISLYLYDINDLDLVVQTSFELNQTSTPNMNHVRFNNKTLHKLVIYIWIHCLENGILFLLIICYFCCMQWMDTDTMPFQLVLLRCKLTFKSFV